MGTALRALVIGLAAAGVAVAVPALLDSYDNPVVVDNGPIVVRRAGVVPDQEGGDPRHWGLRLGAPLRQLQVWSWPSAGAMPLGLAQPLPISEVDVVEFRLVTVPGRPPTTAMTLRRDPWWRWPFAPRVRLHAGVDLRFDPSAGGLTPAGAGAALRIGEVRVGDRVVCLRDAVRPQPGPCRAWSHAPHMVQVTVCANPASCPQP